MEDAKKIVGRRIKNLREARGLNQIDFSIALGVSDKTISSWEIGRTEPNIAMMNKIAEFFNVTLDQLMGWEEDTNISNRDDIIENVGTMLSDAGYSLSCESYDDVSFPIKDKSGNTIKVLRDGYLISLYNNAVKNNTLSYKTFTEAVPESSELDSPTVFPKKFTDPLLAVQFIRSLPVLEAYGGYDLDKMSDQEKIDFANEVSMMIGYLVEKKSMENK